MYVPFGADGAGAGLGGGVAIVPGATGTEGLLGVDGGVAALV